ncbi:unnamed protein product [Chilo suppressalis]|uniref:Peptidase S1 domain-containing protein n=1 Tax=Chilo suppressalis TaxID=168631 RepID=A0ABN8ECS1_CHISP|nr:unnamed protein product [Chilo suppressalis]
MKGLFVLLCVFVAAQARSTGVQSESHRIAAAPGENPWVVHLRLAVSTSGLLNSCVGSLLNNRWVLTSSRCTLNQRFIWLRYDATAVYSPSLVTETSQVTTNAGLGLSLININRNVEFTANIAPVRLASGNVVPASAKFCGYGANDDGAAGEYLNCAEVDVAVQEDGSVVASADATQFDLGAPLVADGVQYGVLVQVAEENVFVNIASAREWISDVTGIPLESDESDSNESNGDSNESNGDSGEDDTEEDESSGDSEEDESVRFVN